MADRILEGPRAKVACRWCGELIDHMKDTHKCMVRGYKHQAELVQARKLLMVGGYPKPVPPPGDEAEKAKIETKGKSPGVTK